MSVSRFAALFLVAFLISTELVAAPAPPVREVNIRLYDLVYDHVAHHLYATSPEHPGNLLQLDPHSGEITATFPVGNVPYRLVLDDRRGLWIGLSGDGDVRRFNLETLTAEPKFELGVPGNTHVLQIAPSPTDPDTFAVIAGRVYLVRDGIVLPDSLPATSSTQSMVIMGNYVFSDAFRARMTPTGLVADGSRLFSEIKVADGRFYLEAGAIVDPPTGQTLGQFEIPPLGGERYGIGISAVDNSIYFLSYATNYILSRFDRTSLELTGFYPFQYYPGPVWTTHLVPISTNAAAFHTEEKLIFIDLAPAFARGELSVSAAIETNPVHFGQLVTQSITVTNAGPGYVFDAFLTNVITGDVRYPEIPPGAWLPSFDPNSPYSFPWGQNEYHFELGDMPPGTSRTFRFRVFPIAVGTYTNHISLAAEYESDPSNNSLTLPVEVLNPFTNTIARLAPFGDNVSAFGYDAPTDQIILGTTNGHLGFVDLDGGTIQVPLTGGHPVEHISIASETRTAWVNIWGWSSLHRVPIDNPEMDLERRLGALLRDLAASPVDPNVAAYSTDSRVHFVDYVNWAENNYTNGSGIVRFSEDGKTLYQVLDFDCSLRTFNVSTGSITLQRTFPPVGCFGFFEADGFLYFDDGLVFDPANGTTVTNLNLSYPSFVVLDPAGTLNILTRVNGDWLIRQLDRTTFAEITRFHLGRRDYSPSSAVAAGHNRIAFRNRPGEVILVRFDADPAVVRIEALNTANGFLLQFATAADASYQLEASPSIDSPTWTPFGEIIPGTGQILQRVIEPNAPSQFFRLVRLP